MVRSQIKIFRGPCTVKNYSKNTQVVIKSRGQGFPQATVNVAPGYFHSKIEEK